MCPASQNTHLPTGRGWPGLEAALGLSWRWRGVLEAELADASGRLLSTWRRARRLHLGEGVCRCLAQQVGVRVEPPHVRVG